MAQSIQRSFAGGELSPALHARADLVRYQNGSKSLLNFAVDSDGGIFNRPGSTFVAKTKVVEIADGVYAHAPARLIEWQFNSTDQTYILEFGPGYIRFHQNGAPVLVVFPLAWDIMTEYVAGDLVEHAGVKYYCVVANDGEDPSGPSGTDFWYVQEDGILEIPTPWGLGFDFDVVDRLQFVQTGDVMTFVSSAGPPGILTRLAHSNWTLKSVPTVGPGSAWYFSTEIPSVANLANSGTVGVGYYWYVAIILESGEEGPYVSTSSNQVPNAVTPITLTWDNPTIPYFGFNVYRFDGRGMGLVGLTVSNFFVDNGGAQDLSELPFIPRDEFKVTNSYFPTVIASYQQRRLVANMAPALSDVWGSRIGNPLVFDKKIPIPADGSLRFTVEGRRVGEIRHMVDIGVLVVFTNDGEVVVKGDSNGVLRPGEINPQFYSHNGASFLRPLLIGSSILYVQEVGCIVRDLGFDIAQGGKDGYRDTDLTSSARHLFRGHTIDDWAYQKSPYSISWAKRDDGLALGLTYDKEQDILAWHRHETSGLYERFACVNEGLEHALYQVVLRRIDGEEVRCIERTASRYVSDIRDAIFMDCALTFDGRNETRDLSTENQITMKIAGASNWGYGQEMDLVCNMDFFEEAHVGDLIQIRGTWIDTDEDGVETARDLLVNCPITSFVAADTVKIRPDKDIPEGMQELDCVDWARAVDEVQGLDHLEGCFVSVLADGKVIASPNNPSYTKLKVTDGKIPLPGFYAVVQTGLPYVSDFSSLNLEVVQATVSNKLMLVNEVTAFVEETLGLHWGTKLPPAGSENMLDGLQPMPIEGLTLEGPIPLKSGKSRIQTAGTWDLNAAVVARQVDPLPVKITAIVPTGYVPGGK